MDFDLFVLVCFVFLTGWMYQCQGKVPGFEEVKIFCEKIQIALQQQWYK